VELLIEHSVILYSREVVVETRQGHDPKVVGSNPHPPNPHPHAIIYAGGERDGTESNPRLGSPKNKRAYHYRYSYSQAYGEREFGHFNSGGI